MAQRPKEHVRAGIVSAAAALFAEIGYEQTTMAAVAERAHSSIGNVYRYFPSKEDLFAAVLPREFTVDLQRMTRRRIKALGTVRDLRLLARDARYHVLSGELLDHCLAHPERIVILLGKARGTPYAAFAPEFTANLVQWALAYAHNAWPGIRLSAGLRFALEQIYANHFAALAQAFSTFRNPEQIRDAVSHLTAHHQGGLKHLFETAVIPAEGEIPVRRRKAG